MIVYEGTNSIMSLRRSARAPTTQPAATTQQHSQSSASSVSSGRPDRNARSNQKLPSPRSSVAENSRSSEDRDDSAKPHPRRTRSSNGETKNEHPASVEDDVDENEEEETRCICGQLEYPGLPVIDNDAIKDRSQVDSDPASVEDNTGWFIQCDNCQVWQHGGCVGILDESQNPDKYFCEQCRKDLHKVLVNVNGYVSLAQSYDSTTEITRRKYSRYLPMQDAISTPSSPEPKVKDSSRKTRESRTARSDLESLGKGRRATMNSRESAYDEAEQLRRAIEASKKDSMAKSANGTRKGKRSRSESAE